MTTTNDYPVYECYWSDTDYVYSSHLNWEDANQIQYELNFNSGPGSPKIEIRTTWISV